MPTYEVTCGNIGTVYSGNLLKEALQTYSEYKRQSLTGIGRAGGEEVTMMKHGDILYGHAPPEDLT